MGTYYSIYAEARVGNKWYNISPLIRDIDGEAKVQPVLSGQSMLREAYEKLEDDCYMRGHPSDISDELKKVFYHKDDEKVGPWFRDMTYKEYYKQTLCVVNYGKSVKNRIKKDRPNRYQGYVEKHCLATYEIGEVEDIINWMPVAEYKELSDEEKRDYTYYEWNEWGDWYGVYSELVQKVDCLLDFFNE